MKEPYIHINGIISAAGLGLLTALCCFAVACDSDSASIRTEYYWDVILPNAVKIGMILIVVAPLLVIKWVKWRYTFINLPIYMCLYTPLKIFFRDSFEQIIPEIAAMPVLIRAVGLMMLIWGTQSAVFLVCNVIRKRKK